MNTGNKRKDNQQDDNKPKRVKKECDYGERCYRRNPFHFREFSHPHLEAILNTYKGSGPFSIPEKYSMDRCTIEEQLEVLRDKKIYTPWVETDANLMRAGDSNDAGTSSNSGNEPTTPQNNPNDGTPDRNQKPLKGILKKPPTPKAVKFDLSENPVPSTSDESQVSESSTKIHVVEKTTERVKADDDQTKHLIKNLSSKNSSPQGNQNLQSSNNASLNVPGNSQMSNNSSRQNSSDYRPIVQPTRRAEDFLNVVVPKGQMLRKHEASAPYHMFYTTITDSKETHRQPYSITFQEILDRSLGELKSSLQINFMVEPGWLLAQYYFAGYSEKKMTILYGQDDSTTPLATINEKKPHIDAHKINMGSPFGTHHTKMMILCYEDGSLRVVVSTANLYLDDWENRVQGLWFSPRCPELPPTAMPHDGDSPTLFKKSLLQYLNKYHLPCLTPYVERVKRCDFSHINVFLVASVPGGHFDADWGLKRIGALLRQHCCIPPTETTKWPLFAEASSLGSYGDDPNLWLTGDFLHHFSKIKEQPQTLCAPPSLKLIYPSLENVKNSHDDLLGGGCLPYSAAVHTKQLWLNKYLYQWRATSTKRNRAMPHIKCYTRVSPDHARAGYFLLTSANCSKAAWGSINKGNSALRIMSYEAGVLFLPKFIIKEDFFPLQETARNRLVLPYDVPLTKYGTDMSPWVWDYLQR